MLENGSILSSAVSSIDSISGFLLCTVCSLVFGIAVAAVYMYKNIYSKSFILTLALLPAMIQTVIMLVNGNLGTGVAVLGAFSLVRFRSVPGSAREIGSIFFAMAIGLSTGMGYLLYALFFLIIIGGMNMLLLSTGFGTQKRMEKELKITIPESMDYEGAFDDLFSKYTNQSELVSVKTSNMGSLFELHYHVTLKKPIVEKVFLDELRCRNGNLNIVCGRAALAREEL